MDPLGDIRCKLSRLPETAVRAGLEAVWRHLEVAEGHYDRARVEQNDDYFNDAVYRANQAYEGALKEAWRVLKDADPSKKQTHQLERGLATSGALTDRARGLMENYRQQWRNPATHDHTLLFGQQDASLAIWSAIAFATVLMDQIITKISENEAISQIPPVAQDPKDRTKRLDEYLFAHFRAFAEAQHAFLRPDGSPRSEAETLGWLSAYLKQRLPDLELEAHPRLPTGLRPDLVLSRGGERVVVELKRGDGAHGVPKRLRSSALPVRSRSRHLGGGPNHLATFPR